MWLIRTPCVKWNTLPDRGDRRLGSQCRVPEEAKKKGEGKRIKRGKNPRGTYSKRVFPLNCVWGR